MLAFFKLKKKKYAFKTQLYLVLDIMVIFFDYICVFFEKKQILFIIIDRNFIILFDLKMNKKRTKGRWEKTFRYLLLLLVLLWAGFVLLKALSVVNQWKITQNKDSLTQQEQQLSAHESAISYDKFLLINDLEQKVTEMPWFEHIPKILQILQDLQNLDSGVGDIITLSDFEVSLDEITLKWSVSSLKALYYNSSSGNFKALLDRFEELDFIEDMTIRSYNRTSDRYFEFVLNAKVVNNDWK